MLAARHINSNRQLTAKGFNITFERGNFQIFTAPFNSRNGSMLPALLLNAAQYSRCTATVKSAQVTLWGKIMILVSFSIS
ncbi:hypothetical protein SA5R_21980 [Pantoea dispersa]|uniref:Uncharacterized protein n=1 Tax=Pantoea dispersa TaxID=59814 RepID=A0A8E1V5S7_9GAMM|nr:hypothetical protein SA2_21545 [Pantoea dispersa]KTS19352.1 hypothetical protein SA4R_22345 [Pantoea dispersa]KTS54134.1 hypothetical protein SA5R_21980 [Pantoea dispersa]KTS65810.1 hypothetical protein SA3R_19625 [Pantoea dispersa]